MTMSALMQATVITAVVGWSVLFAARRFLPVASRRVQAKIAGAFGRPSLPAWLRGVALRLQPQATGGGSCGDGCSSCGGCATAVARPVVEAQSLTFHPRART